MYRITDIYHLSASRHHFLKGLLDRDVFSSTSSVAESKVITRPGWLHASWARGNVTGREQGRYARGTWISQGEGVLNIHSTDIALCHILFNNNEYGQRRRRRWVLKLAPARRVTQHQVTTGYLTWGEEDLLLTRTVCSDLRAVADGWGLAAWEPELRPLSSIKHDSRWFHLFD